MPDIQLKVSYSNALKVACLIVVAMDHTPNMTHINNINSDVFEIKQ